MIKPFQIVWELIEFGIQALFVYVLAIILIVGILIFAINDGRKEWDREKGIFTYTEYVEKEVDGKITKEIEHNPVPIMTRKQAQDHYLANRSRSLAKQDPHCKEFEEFYRPAFTYKALNRLIQGSAADMTKKAMVLLYRKGILPHIQIHDELCISVKNKDQATQIKEVMETVIILEVPNKVDYEFGPNWGNIK